MEFITYEQVRQGCMDILKCAREMQRVFDEVSGSMKNMTSESNFVGTASNALSGAFKPFEGKFAEYIKTVEGFAEKFNVTTDDLEAMERRLAQQASELG